MPCSGREEDLIVRLHWAKLLPPGLTVAVSLLTASLVTSDRSMPPAMIVSMAVGVALIVCWPYYEAFKRWRLHVKNDVSPARKRTIAVSALGSVVLTSAIAWWLSERGVSFAWVQGLMHGAGITAEDTVRHMINQPVDLIWVMVCLAMVKLAVAWFERRINGLVISGHWITYRTGILRREPKQMNRNDVTDQSFVRWWKLPWGTLRLESPGQDQAITTIYWVPVGFLKQLGTSET